MLPYIYPNMDTTGILEDIEGSEIPPIHKLMFAWIKNFTQDSSNLRHSDIELLVRQGVPQADIVEWANVAATQTWFVMSADGGGIPLEGNAIDGTVLGHEREYYHSHTIPTVPKVAASRDQGALCWVETNEQECDPISEWSMSRYGSIPNLFRATSLTPEYYPRHQLALELLDNSQTDQISSRQHSIVRRMINRCNNGSYLDDTTRKLTEIHCGQVVDEVNVESYAGADRVILDFADKLVRSAYKVTEKDAQRFRDEGLGDEAYVDVINTVSIQTSLDRLSNALGIMPDSNSLIAV